MEAVTISFRTKLLASHAAVALVVAAIAVVSVERSLSRRLEAQIDNRLTEQARAVAAWLEQAGHPERLAARLAGVVGAEVTIVGEGGRAIAGSTRETRLGEKPEIAAARRGEIGRATRRSGAAGEPVRYIAVRAPHRLVVRLGLAVGEMEATRGEIRRQLGLVAAAALLIAFALAFLIASALSRRLRAASGLARRVAAGSYDVDAVAASTDEVGVLTGALVGAAVELRETDARRRRFLANVAHEIRTPVTSIRGYAETLAGADIDPATRAEFLQTIHRNAVRISDLITELLELEALAAGKNPPLARESVELRPIAEAVLATSRGRIEERNASLELALAGQTALGDPDAIERILQNLIDNALQHGGDGVAIEVTAAGQGDRIAVAVADDGPGIPAERRAEIFDRFVSGSGGGSGLGLAIARELAQAMHGELILADSTKGTRFEVLLEGGYDLPT
jgi:two-component system phosphate regulon sensor histidine kinase PhoR